ncbi:hypothetical protein EJ06DRAFT_519719 [Trichodelitschia bisporula]|uniref:Uncharacterized protein n=1 Tax=Trichodelitschia bisporula TaxID=703511 RepID=A0A6G1I3P9_9PEZI|nr:hypothetical protein EJ06DRAFT_519719 [Trichodelitschia bisporula]
MRKLFSKAGRRTEVTEDPRPHAPSSTPSSGNTRLTTIVPSSQRSVSPVGASSLVSRPAESASLSKEPSSDPQYNPLGLTVLYTPDGQPTADIIFIHGLGGTSHSTWCKDGDRALFWPAKWLPAEAGLQTVRIITYGYNANWQATNSNILDIPDFAQDLLALMKNAQDDDTGEELGIGKTPIIFVAHSMGGLVAKAAFLRGQDDPEYSEIVQAVHSMIFLATPHRGSDFAGTLNTLLSVSILIPKKDFLTSLDRNSRTLQQINQQFRHHISKLSLFSFWETLETPLVKGNLSLGFPVRVMVLVQDSATLLYPGEAFMSLDADHHGVCKFTSRDDPNYKKVRNQIRAYVRDAGKVKPPKHIEASGADASGRRDEIHRLKALLAVDASPEDDYDFFRDRWMEGTCEWILQEPIFGEWLEQRQSHVRCAVLWLHALPASGKSVLASFIINHVRELNLSCQFFFFRFSEPLKRSASALLRSLAFQIAHSVPQFRKALLDMHENEERLGEKAAKTLWRNVFVPHLLSLDVQRPLYWIIDGLDECDEAPVVFELLSSLKGAVRLPVHILVLSQHSQKLNVAFHQLNLSVPEHMFIRQLAMRHSDPDIHLYTISRIRIPNWNQSLEHKVKKNIVERANGNFLWVHLVVEQMPECFTEADIEEALKDLPPDLDALYHRMDQNMAKRLQRQSRELAHKILAWTTCSRTLLTLSQLAEALDHDYDLVSDLRTTIPLLCGHFVVIDNKDQVNMLHQTARDFIVLNKAPRPHFFVDLDLTHGAHFVRCMKRLPERDASILEECGPSFLRYAATSWPFHLSQSRTIAWRRAMLLMGLFTSERVLLWIEVLGRLRELDALTSAAESLKGICTNEAFQEIYGPWSVDLRKLFGRFGYILLRAPTAIRWTIPAFCPRNSKLHQQFSRKARISLTGVSNLDWDHSVAQMHMASYSEYEPQLVCSNEHVALSTSVFDHRQVMGTSTVWTAQNFVEDISVEEPRAGELSTHPYFTASCFSLKGDTYVYCGVYTTRIWQIPLEGREPMVIEHPPDLRGRIMSVTYLGGTTIIAAFDDKAIRRLSQRHTWEHRRSFEEPDELRYWWCCVAFSPDKKRIVVGYRGAPVTVYYINPNKSEVRRHRRNGPVQPMRPHESPRDEDQAIAVCWNPRSHHVLGLYKDACVFKWNPDEGSNNELMLGSHPQKLNIQCSPNGRLFAVCDQSGVVTLFHFETFAQLCTMASGRMSIWSCAVFSPDSRRLYHHTSAACTVWEPPVLQIAAEEPENVAKTLALQDVQVWDQRTKPLTFAVEPFGRYFCTMNRAGDIKLFDKDGDFVSCVWNIPPQTPSGHNPLHLHLEWDARGTRLAIVMSRDTITVLSFEVLSDLTKRPSPQVWLVCEVSLAGTLAGLDVQAFGWVSFSPDGSHLAMTHSSASGKGISVVSCANGARIAMQDMDRTCMGMLTDPNTGHLLVVVLDAIIRLNWTTLHKIGETFFDKLPSHALGSSFLSFGDAAKDAGRDVTDWALVAPSDIAIKPGRVPYKLIPRCISREINWVIAAQNEALVFFDNDHALCTWRLDFGPAVSAAQIRRHYFLPKEWVEYTAYAWVGADGSLFFPRGWEMAVIQPRFEFWETPSE